MNHLLSLKNWILYEEVKIDRIKIGKDNNLLTIFVSYIQ